MRRSRWCAMVLALSCASCSKAKHEAPAPPAPWIPVAFVADSGPKESFVLRRGDEIALLTAETNQIAWTSRLPGADWYLSPQVIPARQVGSALVLVSSHDQIAVFDAASGALGTLIEPSAKPVTDVLVPNQARLVCEYQDGVEVFDTETGRSLYRLRDRRPIAVVAEGGTLFVATNQRDLVAVDLTRGTEKWTARFSPLRQAELRVEGTAVVLTSMGENPIRAFGFDAATGTAQSQTEAAPDGSVALFAGTTAYVFDRRAKTLARYDSTTQVWSTPTDTWPRNELSTGGDVLAPDGEGVSVAQLGRHAVAFESRSGKLLADTVLRDGEELFHADATRVIGFVARRSPFTYGARKIPDLAVEWELALVDPPAHDRPFLLLRSFGLVTVEFLSDTELRLGVVDSTGGRAWETILSGLRLRGVSHRQPLRGVPRSGYLSHPYLQLEDARSKAAHSGGLVIGEQRAALGTAAGLATIELATGARAEVRL